MDKVVALFESFNTGNWIALFAAMIAVISCSFAGANYLAGRRERNRKTLEATPIVKATINTTMYPHQWRSVQLHLVPSSDENRAFKCDQWHIECAQLLRPRNAVIARAENDDYASGVFYPENPVRVLTGKPAGRPQRFALEFFIKFKDKDERPMAKFKVVFSHVDRRHRYTARVWAQLPAEY